MPGPDYSTAQIQDALDAAQDLIIRELDLGERDDDLLDLLRRGTAPLLARPDITTLDALTGAAGYQSTAAEIRKWWTGWA